MLAMSNQSTERMARWTYELGVNMRVCERGRRQQGRIDMLTTLELVLQVRVYLVLNTPSAWRISMNGPTAFETPPARLT